MPTPLALSVIIPAYNEGSALKRLLPEVLTVLPEHSEVLVIDDGSSDDTATCADGLAGVRVIRHTYNMGNGAAVKTGARNARGTLLLYMDADGQHRPDDIPRLLQELDKGYDMVIGARSQKSQASVARLFANSGYNTLASWITGRKILDLTSGFRVVKARRFREFLSMLPNGFSYPTTITMAFFRSGYAVQYMPIEALQRRGKSHIKPLRDGMRFLLIIFRIGTLYSPMRLFLPISTYLFALGLIHHINTWMDTGRFPNMSLILYVAALLVFLISLLSEQITLLIYQRREAEHHDES